MDRFTLGVIDCLFFCLYAGLMVVSARISGGRRGATWFAASNVVRAGAVGLVLLSYSHGAEWRVPGALLLTVGMAMLHRSFAEVVDRGNLFWNMQLWMVSLVAVGSMYELRHPGLYPVELIVASAVVGVQAALTASVLFSYSGEGLRVPGWFAGVALSGISLLHLMRLMVTLRFESLGYAADASRIDTAVTFGSLVANAAIAFGFVLLSMGKQRLELLWRAQVDELTGLMNRWAFKRLAQREIFRSKRTLGKVALLVMDLDGFKALNDGMGHGCGDAVLQGVAEVLRETVREFDSVGRMGGDEFCVMLPETTLAEALVVGERLRTGIERLAIPYGGRVLRVEASCGVSSSEFCGLNWQILVEHADRALYRAKALGRNKVLASDTVVETPANWSEAYVQRGAGRQRRAWM